MTQRDKWDKRPSVQRYWAYKEHVRYCLRSIDQSSLLAFLIPVSESWSNKKKQELNWTPHEQRPDVDNLVKGLYDAVYGEDSHISMCFAVKIWVPADMSCIAICSLPNMEVLTQSLVAQIREKLQQSKPLR